MLESIPAAYQMKMESLLMLTLDSTCLQYLVKIIVMGGGGGGEDFYCTGGPTLTELKESLLSSPSTISCLSCDSPPTDVIWEKDGERIYSNSSSIYQLTQTLVNRKTSTYNNTLTINGTIEKM